MVSKLQTDLAVMVEDAEKKKETAEGIAEVRDRRLKTPLFFFLFFEKAILILNSSPLP